MELNLFKLGALDLEAQPTDSYLSPSGDLSIYQDPQVLYMPSPTAPLSTSDIDQILLAPVSLSPSPTPAPAPAPSDLAQSPTEQTLDLAPQTVNYSTDYVLTINFVDKVTGQVIEVNGKMIDINTGTVLSQVANSSQVNISNTGVPWNQLGLQFYKTGYKKIVTTAEQVMNLQSNNDGTYTLYFEKGVGTTVIFEAAALAALLFIYYRHKKRKGVGAFNKQKAIDIGEVVLLGIGAYLLYKMVKKILDFLGVTKSAATISLDGAETNPKSPWNPQYYLNLLSEGVQWSTGITATTAAQWIQDLKDAMGFFGDNESKVMGILKRCQTQATLSFLAWEYQHETGEDFLAFLRGRSSWYPWAGLSDDDLYNVQNYILQLPKY